MKLCILAIQLLFPKNEPIPVDVQFLNGCPQPQEMLCVYEGGAGSRGVNDRKFNVVTCYNKKGEVVYAGDVAYLLDA